MAVEEEGAEVGEEEEALVSRLAVTLMMVLVQVDTGMVLTTTATGRVVA